MELLGNNPSMHDLIEKLNEVVGSLNNSLPNTDSEIAEVKKLVSFGSGVLAGRLNAKLWYFKTQELMTASTELCEGDSCFVLKDGVTTGEGTFEYWYIYKTSDVVDIIDSYVDLSNPDLVAVKLQDMTLKDVKDTLSAQISDQSKDLNTKISNLRTYTETALSGKADLVDGLIPASQLPSYVDDIVESWLEDIEFPENAYAKEDTEMTTPLTPEFSKIYVNLLNNKTYRWGGSFYVEVSKSLAIGETATTAFAGDRGKTLETKIQNCINYVTPEMYGAVGDGVADDTSAINKAISSQKPVLFTKTYGVTSTVFVTGSEIYINSTIKAIEGFSLDYSSVITLNKNNATYDFTGLIIDCNNIANRGIVINQNKLLYGISINNAYILDATEVGLFIYSSENISSHAYVNNLKVYNKRTLATGIYIRNNADWTFDNVELFYVNIGVDFTGTHIFNNFHIWAGGSENNNNNTIGFLHGALTKFDYPIFIQNIYFDGINTCIKNKVETTIVTSNCYVLQPSEGTYGTNCCFIDTEAAEAYITINGLNQKTVSDSYVPIIMPEIVSGAMYYKNRYIINSCKPFPTEKWNVFNAIVSDEYEAVPIFEVSGGILKDKEILIGNFLLPKAVNNNSFYFDFEIVPSFRFDAGFQKFMIRFFDVNENSYSCELISKDVIGDIFYELILGEVIENDNKKIVPVYMKWKRDNPYNSGYVVKTTRNQSGIFSVVNTACIREDGYYTPKLNLTTSNV